MSMRFNQTQSKHNKNLGHLKIFRHYQRSRCRKIVHKTQKCSDNNLRWASEIVKKKFLIKNNRLNNLIRMKNRSR